MGAAAIGLAPEALAQRAGDIPDPSIDLYPGKRNEKYVLDRPVTDEKINGNYNNFYEFNSSKQVTKQAQALKIRPWTIKIDGMVEKPMEVGIDDLVRKFPIEERLYRHRCVEAWSMAVPWSGFPMAELVKLANPLSSAKYVRMETFLDKSIAPASGQQAKELWPYIAAVVVLAALRFGINFTRRYATARIGIRIEARQFSDSTTHHGTSSGFFREYDTGIFFNIPWFNQRKYRSAITEAQKSREGAELELDAARSQVLGAVRDQLRKIETYHHHFLLYRDRLVPLSRDAADAARLEQQRGATAIVDFYVELPLDEIEQLGRAQAA